MLCQGLARLAKHQGRISIAGDAPELAKMPADCRPQRNPHKRKKTCEELKEIRRKMANKAEKTTCYFRKLRLLTAL